MMYFCSSNIILQYSPFWQTLLKQLDGIRTICCCLVDENNSRGRTAVLFVLAVKDQAALFAYTERADKHL